MGINTTPGKTHRGRNWKGCWRSYLKRYWFVGILTLIVAYLVVQIIALVVYIFLPDRPSDASPYFPHKIVLPDGSTREVNP